MRLESHPALNTRDLLAGNDQCWERPRVGSSPCPLTVPFHSCAPGEQGRCRPELPLAVTASVAPGGVVGVLRLERWSPQQQERKESQFPELQARLREQSESAAALLSCSCRLQGPDCPICKEKTRLGSSGPFQLIMGFREREARLALTVLMNPIFGLGSLFFFLAASSSRILMVNWAVGQWANPHQQSWTLAASNTFVGRQGWPLSCSPSQPVMDVNLNSRLDQRGRQ